jgi:RNA polymerase sigma-70 factor (ECF subfamily)
MKADLINNLRNGKEKAYQYLFDHYYVSLTAFAFKFLQNREISKDIVQNIFIRIFQNRDHLTIASDIKNYLFKAVHNECLNELKKENTRETHYFQYASESSSHSYESELGQTEKEYKIYQAIEKLSPKCRQIFLMSRIEGKKNPEIAAELGLSVRTIETQISQALKSLRKTVAHIYRLLFCI